MDKEKKIKAEAATGLVNESHQYLLAKKYLLLLDEIKSLQNEIIQLKDTNRLLKAELSGRTGRVFLGEDK